jgi:hypothetical protein
VTIVVSALGHYVAVLAADSHEWFVPWKTGALTSAGVTEKVRADPVRPVAVAITGLSRVRGEDVFGHVGELMSRYGGDRALDATQIAGHLGKGLETMIIAEVTEAQRMTKDAITPVTGITLFVVSWNGNRPSVARSRVDSGGFAVLEQDEAVIVSAPKCLSEFYAGGPKVGYEGDDAIERQVVEVVRSGIEEERRLHGGTNEHCGGPIRWAVLTAGDVTLHSSE